MVFKFEKTSTTALVAHTDMLRAVTYAIRRAGLSAQYSQGFNPHMEMVFSPPLALGVESLCEYVSVQMPYSADALEKLNAVCPQGLKFVKSFDTAFNPASKITKATYRIQASGIGSFIADILAEHYTITYEERGQTVEKDVSERIFSAKKVDENCAEVTLAVGNNNLRPDRLVKCVSARHGADCDYTIVKTESFVDDVETDVFLERLCSAGSTL